MKKAVTVATLLLSLGCAKERPLKPVLANSYRVKKSDLAGTYLYSRTLTQVKNLATSKNFLAPGFLLDSDKLVQMNIKENVLEVSSVDPLYSDSSAVQRNGVVLSFPIRHVDVLKKQNVDGEDTHEEEETESRRASQEREFIVVDLSTNLVELAEFAGAKSVTPLSGIQIDPAAGAINFKIAKNLSDGTSIEEHFSFLRSEGPASYIQKQYPLEFQNRFGFFKTETFQFDKYNRMIKSLKQDYINRWDLSKPIQYYLSPGFPEHLKPIAREVMAGWNKAFKEATGKEVLELHENLGQEVGDLRYSFISYVDSQEVDRLLGYGPSVTNPRTGEIVKADVFLYGGTLKRSIYNERKWLELDSGQVSGMSQGRLKASQLKGLVGKLDPAKLSKEVPRQMPLISKAQSVSAANVLNQMRSEAISRPYSTEMTEGVFNTVKAQVGNLSDEELEVEIFKPLLAHELGHNFGLRHNFMASADKAHFGSRDSSSVMDYGFLSAQESPEPAPYDVAALKIAYGAESERESLLEQRFLFCTDENLFDSRRGLCHQFDRGTTLTQVAEHQIDRYRKSYAFNNLRQDRVHFGDDLEGYFQRVAGYLLPVRLLLDHAQAIVVNSEGSDLALYTLLRHQIEATEASTEIRELSLPGGKIVKLDIQTIRTLREDALKARAIALASLVGIVQDESRPDQDAADFEFNELMVRGVLLDKLIATQVVLMRTADPLGSGVAVTAFEPFHQELSVFIADVLSNTRQGSNGAFGIGAFDPNIRMLALLELKELQENPSLVSGELLELIKLSQVRDGDSDAATLTEVAALRQERQSLLVGVMLGQATEADEVRLAEISTKLIEFNLVQVELRDQLKLKTELISDEFGALQTASGRLLHFNLAEIEDAAQALGLIEAMVVGLLQGELQPEVRENLTNLLAEVRETELLYRRYLSSEKIFVEELYRTYTPVP